jgi:urease accessory protein
MDCATLRYHILKGPIMRFLTWLLSPLLVFSAAPVLAHHPLAGLPMETGVQGLLSGLAHPLLGFDHLFFVLAVGVAAVLAGRRLGGPLVYIGAMLAGCGLALAGVSLPLAQAVIAASLLVLGGVILSGRTLGPGLVLALFAGFGLFHGAAFAEGIVGVEAAAPVTVQIGYLLGLGVVQYALALGAGLVTVAARAERVRLAGAMVAGVGLFLSLEVLEAPLVALITRVAV